MLNGHGCKCKCDCITELICIMSCIPARFYMAALSVGLYIHLYQSPILDGIHFFSRMNEQQIALADFFLGSHDQPMVAFRKMWSDSQERWRSGVCGKMKCRRSNTESEHLIDLLLVGNIYHLHSISHSFIPHASHQWLVSNSWSTLIWKVNKLISSGGMHGCRVKVCCLSARPLLYIWLDKKLPMAAHLKRAG